MEKGTGGEDKIAKTRHFIACKYPGSSQKPDSRPNSPERDIAGQVPDNR